VEEPLPVTEDDGYTDAITTFGAEAVEAALASDASIARTALADCHRWRTGDIDPALLDLLDPALLATVEAELERPEGRPRSLLDTLPDDDDGNGHNLAAAVRGGCDASAPLHVSVGTFTDSPKLSAGQDWLFTSIPDGAGWRLVDVTTGGSSVNWAPPLPA
jgi:hypothetical protein